MEDDTATYVVLTNQEIQYCIWPDYKVIPSGWKSVGKVGSKEECLAYINEAWTDMRPFSLRQKMEEIIKDQLPSRAFPVSGTLQQKSLVERLCEGNHRIEVELRPERSAKLFKEAIDRDYIHIKFAETKGGTELGLRLNRNTSDFSAVDFDNGKGTAHVEGNLTFDYVRVNCIADIDVSTLTGKGRLVKVG